MTFSLLRYQSDGKISYWSNGAEHEACEYVADRWFFIQEKLVWDAGKGKFDEYDLLITDQNGNEYFSDTALPKFVTEFTDFGNLYIPGHTVGQYALYDFVKFSTESLAKRYPTDTEAMVTYDAISFGETKIVKLSTFTRIKSGSGTDEYRYRVDGGSWSSWYSYSNFILLSNESCESSFQVQARATVGEVILDTLSIEYIAGDVSPPTDPVVKVLGAVIEGGYNRLEAAWTPGQDDNYSHDVIRIRQQGEPWKYLEVASGSGEITFSDTYNENIPVKFRHNMFGSGASDDRFCIPQHSWTFGSDFTLTANITYEVSVDSYDTYSQHSGYKSLGTQTIVQEAGSRRTLLNGDGLD